MNRISVIGNRFSIRHLKSISETAANNPFVLLIDTTVQCQPHKAQNLYSQRRWALLSSITQLRSLAASPARKLSKYINVSLHIARYHIYKSCFVDKIETEHWEESYKRECHVKSDVELSSMLENRHYFLDLSSRWKKIAVSPPSYRKSISNVASWICSFYLNITPTIHECGNSLIR